MASTKEIKLRMNGIRETQKITNAMYLIASTKMRKAKSELDETRPYFNALRGEIQRIFRTVEDVECRYFLSEEEEKKLIQAHEEGTAACLIITADKGLAGAYNQNVIHAAEKLLKQKPDTRLFIVGEYGRQYFKKHNYETERFFQYTAQNPTMRRAREIGRILTKLYDKKEISSIYIIYTDWKNGMTEEVLTTRLLPFSKSHFAGEYKEGEPVLHYEFSPSPASVLTSIMPNYISGFIYSALVDSYCSEQNARMTAMNSANQNAEKILGNLSIEYNRMRQAAITQEITEISAGAQGQKKAKEVFDLE